MDRFLGKQVGAYRLVRRLGVGGMASVYLGEDAGIGDPVAIKILHRRHVTDVEMVRRFFDEARAANRIEHPGIVRVFYCDRSDEVGVYPVMELLEGKTLLARWWERQGLETTLVVRVLDQVASAMEAAHAQGVIHRDLKASNVFLARDPSAPGGERAKVLDFGVAKLLRGGAGTRTGYSLGTVSYMPPEQLLDAKNVDARADIYALGVMGYFLLSGRYPYDDEQINRFLLGESLPRPTLDAAPPPLARVILKAMEHDRERRHPTMAAFRAALRRNYAGDDAAMPTLVVDGPGTDADVVAERSTDPRERGTFTLDPAQMADIARAPERPRRSRRLWPLLLPAGFVVIGVATVVALSGPSLEGRAVQQPPPSNKSAQTAPRVSALPETRPRSRAAVTDPADAGLSPAVTTWRRAPKKRKIPRVRRRRLPRASAAPPAPARPVPKSPAPKAPVRLDRLDELKH